MTKLLLFLLLLSETKSAKFTYYCCLLLQAKLKCSIYWLSTPTLVLLLLPICLTGASCLLQLIIMSVAIRAGKAR